MIGTVLNNAVCRQINAGEEGNAKNASGTCSHFSVLHFFFGILTFSVRFGEHSGNNEVYHIKNRPISGTCILCQMLNVIIKHLLIHKLNMSSTIIADTLALL